MSSLIEINGSIGEAGGQVLRTACALSAVTKKSCHVFNIRKGRKKPGLMRQHLFGLRALAQLCQADLKGDFLESQEVWFVPKEIWARDLRVKIETAGSITLVLQTLILPALYSNKAIKITFDGGASDTFFSPTIDHFRFVFLKTLEKMGPKININIDRRGFYPEGGAKLTVEILPVPLKSISLTKRGELKRVHIVSGASENLKKNRVSERQISGAKQILGKLKLPLEEKVEYYPTIGAGSQINIIAQLENTVFGTDNLGKLGKSAEQVGKEAAQNFLREVKSNACLDKHLGDQILPYMALAKEKSEITVSEITPHCQTNILVIEKFLDGKFEIKGNLIKWTPK